MPTRCSAKSKRTGDQCGQHVVDGFTVCKWHGGGTKKAKEAAARRVEEAQAVQILEKQGVTPLKHPVEELLELGAEARSMQRVLKDRVGDPEFADLAGPTFAAYERALERISKFLIDLSKLGLEQRKVSLDEAKATIAAQRVQAGITEWADSLKAALPEQAEAIDQALRDLPMILRKHLLNP